MGRRPGTHGRHLSIRSNQPLVPAKAKPKEGCVGCVFCLSRKQQSSQTAWVLLFAFRVDPGPSLMKNVLSSSREMITLSVIPKLTTARECAELELMALPQKGKVGSQNRMLGGVPGALLIFRSVVKHSLQGLQKGPRLHATTTNNSSTCLQKEDEVAHPIGNGNPF